MAIVADSSSLIGLHAIGRLNLLESVYGEVIIPPAVAREVQASARRTAGRLGLRLSGAVGTLIAAKRLGLLEEIRQIWMRYAQLRFISRPSSIVLRLSWPVNTNCNLPQGSLECCGLTAHSQRALLSLINTLNMSDIMGLYHS